MDTKIIGRRAVLASALLLGLTTFVAAESAPIRVGLIDMYGGNFAKQADAIRTGMQIAFDEMNAKGSLKDHKLVLTTADMGTSVQKATTEARRMILDEKLHYVVVGSHSGAAMALANMVKDTDVFGLGAFATTKRFTGEDGSPMIGRGNLSTVEIGRIMVMHLKSMKEIKRIAIISPDFEFGKHFTEDFMAALKVARPDIVVVRQEWPKLGTADFTPQVTALQADKIDMVVSSLFSGDLANFLKAAKGFNLFNSNTRLFTSGLDILRIATFKNDLPDGTLGTVWYPFYALHNSANTAFIAEVKKRTGTYPSGSTLVGYISGKMLAEGLAKSANPEDAKDLAKTIGTVTFDSPVGPVKVRACDNMALYNWFVGTVKRDPSFPDGIGVTNVEPYNTADYARSCDEIAQVRSK
jgi:branched-chain amino acid transport system substrate-binding protein